MKISLNILAALALPVVWVMASLVAVTLALSNGSDLFMAMYGLAFLLVWAGFGAHLSLRLSSFAAYAIWVGIPAVLLIGYLLAYDLFLSPFGFMMIPFGFMPLLAGEAIFGWYRGETAVAPIVGVVLAGLCFFGFRKLFKRFKSEE